MPIKLSARIGQIRFKFEDKKVFYWNWGGGHGPPWSKKYAEWTWCSCLFLKKLPALYSSSVGAWWHTTCFTYTDTIIKNKLKKGTVYNSLQELVLSRRSESSGVRTFASAFSTWRRRFALHWDVLQAQSATPVQLRAAFASATENESNIPPSWKREKRAVVVGRNRLFDT